MIGLIFFERQVFQMVKKMSFEYVSSNEIKVELFEISKFCKFKLNGLLNIKSNTDSISEEFNYNLMEWIDNEESELKLDKFKFKNGNKKFYFEFTSDQLSVRKDIFKRYGTDINALSKIVTRISNLEGQFRKIRYDEDRYLRDIYKQVGENFIKYALSN